MLVLLLEFLLEFLLEPVNKPMSTLQSMQSTVERLNGGLLACSISNRIGSSGNNSGTAVRHDSVFESL